MYEKPFLVDHRRRHGPLCAFPLADPHDFHWSVSLASPKTRMQRIEPLAPDLEKLIGWAWDFYPPAISLARDDLRRGLPGEGTEGERIALLIACYGQCLRYYLDCQPQQGHFLTRIDTTNRDLELYAGSYRWIVDFLPAPLSQVVFVDYYFFLDHAPADAFGLDPVELAQHFQNRPGRWPGRVIKRR